MVHAIAAHADFLGVPAETELDRTLLAVDELCGFLVACAWVRPEGIHGLTPKSVKKKLKQPSFAAAVNRDDVRGGAEQLGADFDAHVAFVIGALEARADELGLHGRARARRPAPRRVASAAERPARAPCKNACSLRRPFSLHIAISAVRTPVPSALLPTVEHMFASVFSRLPAPLRRALAPIKAFAFLEDAPRPSLAGPCPPPPPRASLGACAGDRRRGPGARAAPARRRRRALRPPLELRPQRPAGARRRSAAPRRRCRASARKGAAANDRRAAVAGGFLHR